MKKLDMEQVDKKVLKTAIYIAWIIAFLILFEKVIGNIPVLTTVFSTAFATITSIISPFLIGFGIAYLMNPAICAMERLIFTKMPEMEEKARMVRSSCIMINYVIVIGGILWIVLYLVPELQESLITFIDTLPSSRELTAIILHFFENFEFIQMDYVTDVLNSLIGNVMSIMENVPNLFGNIVANLVVVGRLTVNTIMGIFIAFYLLYDKEGFLQYGKRALYALYPEESVTKFLYNGNRTNLIFKNFIVGKAIDSLIIGVIACVGMTLLKAPFPMVLGIIIGITNMIPYFGPFIGGVPVFILTAFTSIQTAIFVGIFIIVLQQFDGNYLGPKILGNSVDLSPMMIILAVVVGGALAGTLGMFIGVPILATIKLFFTEFINKKHQEKYRVEL